MVSFYFNETKLNTTKKYVLIKIINKHLITFTLEFLYLFEVKTCDSSEQFRLDHVFSVFE